MGQGLHLSQREELKADPTEVYGSVCRVNSQGEQGPGMLSVRKSVGKHS